MQTHKCPSCKKELKYSTNRHLLRAIKRNCKCQSCSKIGNDNSPDIRGDKNPSKRQYVKEKLREVMKGRIITWNKKISKSCMGRPSPRKGKRLSRETKFRCRVSAIKRIKRRSNGKIVVGYNRTACEYFDWLNKFMGWNGQYATNGGEKEIRGYFLDYYEPTLNLVIEWDEPSHYVRGILRQKDIFRQREIIKELKCEFYRYNQRANIIERVTK